MIYQCTFKALARLDRYFTTIYQVPIGPLTLFLIALLTLHFNAKAMKMYEVCTELFTEFEGIEYHSYLELKNNPLPIKVNYVAAPWHDAIRSRQFDKISRAVKDLHLNGGFTVLYAHEDKMNNVMSLIKSIGIDCIFTPRASTKCTELKGMKIIAYPYYPTNGVNPHPQKDILYSFVGMFGSHPVRRKLAVLHNPPTCIVQDSKGWFHGGHVGTFKDLLARSRFSLCPRDMHQTLSVSGNHYRLEQFLSSFPILFACQKALIGNHVVSKSQKAM